MADSFALAQLNPIVGGKIARCSVGHGAGFGNGIHRRARAMMRERSAIGAVFLTCLAIAGGHGTARAAEAVDLALVLAVDVSRSIDDREFKLQREGYAAALTDPHVLKAIQSGPLRAIAITFVEWSNESEQKVVVDWTVLKDGETGASIAQEILSAPRAFSGRTSISAAIDFAVRDFARSGIEAGRRIIDVSGDGTNNAGRAITEARDEAVAAGVTINALAIINEHPEGVYAQYHVHPPEGLPEYFRQNVIGGPGSFLLQVEGFSSFADAIAQKLISEIAALPQATRHAAQ